MSGDVFGGRVKSTREERHTAYHTPRSAEVKGLMERADQWRAQGDHLAAGDCERAAASGIRFERQRVLRALVEAREQRERDEARAARAAREQRETSSSSE